LSESCCDLDLLPIADKLNSVVGVTPHVGDCLVGIFGGGRETACTSTSIPSSSHPGLSWRSLIMSPVSFSV
jgi:hypothetical protein